MTGKEAAKKEAEIKLGEAIKRVAAFIGDISYILERMQSGQIEPEDKLIWEFGFDTVEISVGNAFDALDSYFDITNDDQEQ